MVQVCLLGNQPFTVRNARPAMLVQESSWFANRSSQTRAQFAHLFDRASLGIRPNKPDQIRLFTRDAPSAARRRHQGEPGRHLSAWKQWRGRAVGRTPLRIAPKYGWVIVLPATQESPHTI